MKKEEKIKLEIDFEGLKKTFKSESLFQELINCVQADVLATMNKKSFGDGKIVPHKWKPITPGLHPEIVGNDIGMGASMTATQVAQQYDALKEQVFGHMGKHSKSVLSNGDTFFESAAMPPDHPNCKSKPYEHDGAFWSEKKDDQAQAYVGVLHTEWKLTEPTSVGVQEHPMYAMDALVEFERKWIWVELGVIRRYWTGYDWSVSREKARRYDEPNSNQTLKNRIWEFI